MFNNLTLIVHINYVTKVLCFKTRKSNNTSHSASSQVCVYKLSIDFFTNTFL